jgi:hypothetical protein
MGILEPSHIILLFFLISGIPLTIWGYRAGAKRKIGSTAGMLLGLFLSFIGILIVFCSDKIEIHQRYPIEHITDQLKKLKDLLDSGAITEAEYNIQKAKILNS